MLNLNENALNETELDSAKSKYALRPPSSSFGLTPMMVQYIQIKEKHENDISRKEKWPQLMQSDFFKSIVYIVHMSCQHCVMHIIILNE